MEEVFAVGVHKIPEKDHCRLAYEKCHVAPEVSFLKVVPH